MTHTQLDDATATRFAEVALENIVRPYPYKVDHLMVSEEDLSTPTVAHPVFYGSYDWHSSVHMHWLLVRLLALRPHLSIATRIRETLTARLRADAIAVELAYFERASSRTFERPYGWAWMLRLQAEMSSLAERDGEAAAWADACAPLAHHLAQRLHDYIETATFPIRTGTHFNSPSNPAKFSQSRKMSPYQASARLFVLSVSVINPTARILPGSAPNALR